MVNMLLLMPRVVVLVGIANNLSGWRNWQTHSLEVAADFVREGSTPSLDTNLEIIMKVLNPFIFLWNFFNYLCHVESYKNLDHYDPYDFSQDIGYY